MAELHRQEEERYTADEQRRIVQLAASLQREEATTLSRSELEAAAEEVGIDPKFVRLAASRIQPTQAARLAPYSMAPVVLLIAMNAYVFSGFMTGRPQEAYLWISLLGSVVVGCLVAITPRLRRSSMVAIGVCDLALVIWWNLVGLFGGQLAEGGWTYMRNFAVAQAFALMVGIAIFELICRVSKLGDDRQVVHIR